MQVGSPGTRQCSPDPGTRGNAIPLDDREQPIPLARSQLVLRQRAKRKPRSEIEKKRLSPSPSPSPQSSPTPHSDSGQGNLYDGDANIDTLQATLAEVDTRPSTPELAQTAEKGEQYNIEERRAKVKLPAAKKPVAFPGPDNPLDSYDSSHDTWFGRATIFMVVLLHTRYHVTFRASALILSILSIIYIALGILQPENPLPTTLQTALHRLDLGDHFSINPMCVVCSSVLEPGVPTDTVCPNCETAIFKPATTRLYYRLTGRKPPLPPPRLVAPIHLLSEQLADLLARPGIEEECERWKSLPRNPNELSDISHGRIWKEMKGSDGKLFFDPQDTSGELRIGVTVGSDA